MSTTMRSRAGIARNLDGERPGAPCVRRNGTEMLQRRYSARECSSLKRPPLILQRPAVRRAEARPGVRVPAQRHDPDRRRSLQRDRDRGRLVRRHLVGGRDAHHGRLRRLLARELRRALGGGVRDGGWHRGPWRSSRACSPTRSARRGSRNKDETPELDDDIEHVMMIMADEMEKLRQKVSHPHVVEGVAQGSRRDQPERERAMSQRRSRRSRNVALVAVPVLALAFTACGGGRRDRLLRRRDRPDRREPLLRRRRQRRRQRGILLALRRQRHRQSDRHGRAGEGRRQGRREATSRRTLAAAGSDRAQRRARAASAAWRPPAEAVDAADRGRAPAGLARDHRGAGPVFWKTELPDGT